MVFARLLTHGVQFIPAATDLQDPQKPGLYGHIGPQLNDMWNASSQMASPNTMHRSTVLMPTEDRDVCAALVLTHNRPAIVGVQSVQQNMLTTIMPGQQCFILFENNNELQ